MPNFKKKRWAFQKANKNQKERKTKETKENSETSGCRPVY